MTNYISLQERRVIVGDATVVYIEPGSLIPFPSDV